MSNAKHPPTTLKNYACAALMRRGDQMQLVPATMAAESLEHARALAAGAFMSGKPGWSLDLCVAWDPMVQTSAVPQMWAELVAGNA